MKYIRTYETEEKFLTDKDSTSRGFRLKPTLYKYSEAGDHVHLELDDPRKHGDSTYMEITLDSNTEFSFYIGNAPDDTQTTMNCSIDWGDGTIETKTITNNTYGFKLVHNYVAGSYKIELYDVERKYSMLQRSTQGYIITPPKSVKRVVLGSDVISIGGNIFDGCTSLTSVYIPEKVTSIGDSAFKGCSSLTSINIPESVNSIGRSAFYNCTSLTSIHIPESVTSIGTYAFGNCTSVTSIYIPESATSIGDNMFEGCTSLTSVHIPEGVTSIGLGAFANCTSLTSINIPEGVTSIEYATFGDCNSIKSIDLPESVTKIGPWGFGGCSSITSINIPEKVTNIGEEAFARCSSLKSISSFNTKAPILDDSDTDGNPVGVFDQLPTNGTLHIKPGATGYDAWLSKLPSGWTIVEDL